MGEIRDIAVRAEQPVIVRRADLVVPKFNDRPANIHPLAPFLGELCFLNGIGIEAPRTDGADKWKPKHPMGESNVRKQLQITPPPGGGITVVEAVRYQEDPQVCVEYTVRTVLSDSEEIAQIFQIYRGLKVKPGTQGQELDADEPYQVYRGSERFSLLAYNGDEAAYGADVQVLKAQVLGALGTSQVQ